MAAERRGSLCLYIAGGLTGHKAGRTPRCSASSGNTPCWCSGSSRSGAPRSSCTVSQSAQAHTTERVGLVNLTFPIIGLQPKAVGSHADNWFVLFTVMACKQVEYM